MVSRSILTAMVGAGVIALFMWLGQLVLGIFETTSSMFDDAKSGKPVSVANLVTDQDIERLRGIPAEIQSLIDAARK